MVLIISKACYVSKYAFYMLCSLRRVGRPVACGFYFQVDINLSVAIEPLAVRHLFPVLGKCFAWLIYDGDTYPCLCFSPVTCTS